MIRVRGTYVVAVIVSHCGCDVFDVRAYHDKVFARRERQPALKIVLQQHHALRVNVGYVIDMCGSMDIKWKTLNVFIRVTCMLPYCPTCFLREKNMNVLLFCTLQNPFHIVYASTID